MRRDLLDAAREAGDQNRRSKSGASKRALLKQIAKQKGQEFKDFEIPYGGERLWELFMRLRRTAGESIQYSEILAYSQLFEVPLYDWEIDLVLEMDAAFIKALRGDKA